MVSRETLVLFDKVISMMDSFQQDYGRCRYSAAMESYVEGHRIIVTISSGWKVIKFVIDETTVRLPKITGFIQGLTDLASLGDLVEAGLPNITGSVYGAQFRMTASPASSGALSIVQTNQAHAGGVANNAGKNIEQINLDASHSSSVYGNSTTAQPESVRYPYFIQVATGAETEANVTNEIELNNPFFFGYYQYFEFEPNNLSWLKSAGQWNRKADYPDYYDWLLRIYNGTETANGVSVRLSTDTYNDYDFVLNTANETFRLPLKTVINPVVENNTNTNLYFYVGETVQNANLINAGRFAETLATKTDMIQASGAGMPSRTVDLSLGASGTAYTAPANGWFFAYTAGGDTSYWVSLTNKTAKIWTCGNAVTGGGGTPGVIVPAKKGDMVVFTYNSTNCAVRFSYAQGSESEA